MKRVKIFWTGGYDSTFRVLQLSQLAIEIEPYYVVNEMRLSTQYELNAIDEITELFKSLNQTKAEFLPLKHIDSENREDAEVVSQAFNNILKTDFLGRQYEFLGAFSKKHPGIELSIHKDDTAIALIEKYGDLKKVHDDIVGDYYVVDESKSSEDIIELFKNYHFPLARYTKKQMKKEYKDQNLEEIMKKTWFCHSPIDGKPCGECNPCKYTIEEGLYDRLDKRALLRYVLNKYKIKFFYVHIKKLVPVVKNDLKRYLGFIKQNMKKYSKYIRTDFRKFLKSFKKDCKDSVLLLKVSRNTYAVFFRNAKKEWKK